MKRLISKKGVHIEHKKLVLYSRGVVLLLVIFAILLGYIAADWIFWLVLFAWSGLGASLGPPIILALFWKKTSKWGVLAGLISGTFVTIVWKSIPVLKTTIYELVPAFLISTFLSVIISLIRPQKSISKI